ncbi:bacterio-opsin activator domain-containing protein [Halovivax gelatinilyticus]|uniref:bacterio-opsin activator domain-containing protein n=1 Tax=Halovivax gelatinilyticus TaxID=2961597 RepID=UPI0020CA7B71|nr:bacterio-opsin activator domain-containing protein [Halovivax gelatinilyticus]
MSTTEVADHLALGRRATYERLDQLADLGYVETKKVGASARVWWVSTDEQSGDRSSDLALYETILSTIDDGIYVLNDEYRFTKMNDAYVEMTGYDRETLLGSHCSLVVGDDVSRESAERLDELARSESGDSASIEADILRADGTRLRAESRFTSMQMDTSSAGSTDAQSLVKVGVVRDVRDRVARERKLETRVRQQEVITELGQRALDHRDLDELMTRAARVAAETIDFECCALLELDESGDRLTMRSGVGWDDGLVGNASVSGAGEQSQAGYTLQTKGSILAESLSSESRFSTSELLRSHGVESAISVVVGPVEEPWGVLTVCDTTSTSLESNDVHFVKSVANILASAINRHADERSLLRQRAQLLALNNLNEVIRNVTDAILAQSTREEIEETVVERLAELDSYTCAWIGGLDVESRSIELRTGADADGLIDSVSSAIALCTDRGAGPTDLAIRRGTIQVTQDVRGSELSEPWFDRDESSSIESAAAIPIHFEDTTYGVLTVYADRSEAFTDDERPAIAQIGEIIGHAIAATERKRALLSDEVVEIDFRIPDMWGNCIDSSGVEDAIELDHVVTVTEDEHVVYGRTDADDIEALEALPSRLSNWNDVSVLSTGETTRFEGSLSEPTVFSLVASHGGSVERAELTNGELRLTVQISPHVDVRTFVETLRETYPSLELCTRKQRTRARPTSCQLDSYLSETLTDKQRDALETAFHAGFFEWPRPISGESVADSLGIAAPTFHQHLRTAERKVLESILMDST